MIIVPAKLMDGKYFERKGNSNKSRNILNSLRM